MKVRVTVGGSIMQRHRGRVGRTETLSAEMRRMLARDLSDELQSIAQSERSADPELRRDVLERAVRRHFGTTL